ncbi:MAG TPA: FGGY family carbohydrate kinase [Actinomycetota bacterium]|nr:FGGY family carbohydrate kinase [Actinomycetota bacterium]
MKDRVLAFDVGTSGVKVVVADTDGGFVGSRYRPYGLHTLPGGWVEQDLDEIYAASADACREVLEATATQPSRILAVGATAQMFNVVPVDGEGRALMPMLSWLDTRASAHAERLAERMPPDEQFERLGSVVNAKDILPKILWLRDERGEVLSRTTWLLDCKEAIVLRLTGRAVIDHAGASAFRLYDHRARDWDRDACRAVGVPPELLPPVSSALGIAGTVGASAATHTGLLAGTPVAVGAGDVAASQVGAGALSPGETHVSLGTAIYFGVTMDRPVPDPSRRLGVLGHMDPERWILWLEIATGGGALAWLLRALSGSEQGDGLEQLDALVRAAEADQGDLIFCPWLSGERVPVFDDRVRGGFFGLDLHHGRGHLLRAVMEGVALQMRWALEYGEAFGQSIADVRAVGGGGIGEVWSAIIANALERPMLVMADPQDRAAFGAAACALVAAGAQPTLSFVRDRVSASRTIQPDPAAAERYRRLSVTYRELYEVARRLARGAEPAPSAPSLGEEPGGDPPAERPGHEVREPAMEGR